MLFLFKINLNNQFKTEAYYLSDAHARKCQLKPDTNGTCKKVFLLNLKH